MIKLKENYQRFFGKNSLNEGKETINEMDYVNIFSKTADILSRFKMTTFKKAKSTYSKELGHELKFAERSIDQVVGVLDDIADKMDDM